MNVHFKNIFWQVSRIPAFCLLASKITISNWCRINWLSCLRVRSKLVYNLFRGAKQCKTQPIPTERWSKQGLSIWEAQKYEKQKKTEKQKDVEKQTGGGGAGQQGGGAKKQGDGETGGQGDRGAEKRAGRTIRANRDMQGVPGAGGRWGGEDRANKSPNWPENNPPKNTFPLACPDALWDCRLLSPFRLRCSCKHPLFSLHPCELFSIWSDVLVHLVL